MLAFALGRFSGSWLLTKFSPQTLMGVYGIISVVLLGVVMADIKDVSYLSLIATFLFLSIMFPCIFALSLRDLGDHTKLASSALVMAIVGGAIMPKVMGWIIDANGGLAKAQDGSIAVSYIVPLVCMLFVSAYGFVYPKLLAKSSAA